MPTKKRATLQSRPSCESFEKLLRLSRVRPLTPAEVVKIRRHQAACSPRLHRFDLSGDLCGLTKTGILCCRAWMHAVRADGRDLLEDIWEPEI